MTELDLASLENLPYTRIQSGDVDVTLPPFWFSYRWAADPVPGRWWCWDTTQAMLLQEQLRVNRREIYDSMVSRYPLEVFRGPLRGNHVNKEYARTLSEERIHTPIISVSLPAPIEHDGQPVGVIIDGCHRLFRRAELGYTYVDVLHLPDVVEAQIRFTPEMVDAVVKLNLVG